MKAIANIDTFLNRCLIKTPVLEKPSLLLFRIRNTVYYKRIQDIVILLHKLHVI